MDKEEKVVSLSVGRINYDNFVNIVCQINISEGKTDIGLTKDFSKCSFSLKTDSGVFSILIADINEITSKTYELEPILYAKNLLELTTEDFANFKNLLSHIRFNTPLEEPVYPTDDGKENVSEAEIVDENV